MIDSLQWIVKLYEIGSGEVEKKLFLDIIRAKMIRVAEADNLKDVAEEVERIKLWEIYYLKSTIENAKSLEKFNPYAYIVTHEELKAFVKNLYT